MRSIMPRQPPARPHFPYTTLFRLRCYACGHQCPLPDGAIGVCKVRFNEGGRLRVPWGYVGGDRKSTRLNSSHEWMSYAVFCLKKKSFTCVYTQGKGEQYSGFNRKL